MTAPMTPPTPLNSEPTSAERMRERATSLVLVEVAMAEVVLRNLITAGYVVEAGRWHDAVNDLRRLAANIAALAVDEASGAEGE